MRKLRNTALADLSTEALSIVEGLNPVPVSGALAEYKQLPRPPPELEPDDVLWGGQAIHDYVVELVGIEQSLSSTYYQITKGLIPARKFSGHLIGSKRGIAQTLAIGTGLVS